jgi:hypothetical protein
MNRNANIFQNTFSCFRWITNMIRWRLKSEDVSATQGSSVSTCRCCRNCRPIIQKKRCYKMCVWDARSVSWCNINYVTEFVFETVLCYWLAANMNLKWLCTEMFVDVSAATQFNDIGPHGTKIIVFNLSRDAKGDLDLDFNTDTKVTTTYRLKSVGRGIFVLSLLY